MEMEWMEAIDGAREKMGDEDLSTLHIPYNNCVIVPCDYTKKTQ